MRKTATAGAVAAPIGGQLTRAAVAGGLTAAWCALPDHVASRRSRAWSKAALATAAVTWYVTRGRPAETGSGASTVDTAVSDRPDARPVPLEDTAGVELVGIMGVVGLVVAAAALVAGSFAVTALSDRAVYRLGERLARRGARYPHTRNGLVLGALAALAEFHEAGRALRH